MNSAAAAAGRYSDGHPLSGLDIVEAAKLSMTPGSWRPSFDHDVWDLSGLANAPAAMEAWRKIRDFTAICARRIDQSGLATARAGGPPPRRLVQRGPVR